MIVFLSHYGNFYGANISLITYLKHSKIPADKITVIVPTEGSFTEELKKAGIRYKVQWFTYNAEGKDVNWFNRPINIIKKIRWLYKLYFLIKSLNPGLVYSNSSVIYYGFFIAKVLKVPHIWHLREFGILDYGLRPDLGASFQKMLISKSEFVIAISKSISNFYKLSESNSKIIFNGVENNLLDLDTKIITGKLKFGVVGLVTPYKNQLAIVKAFHSFNLTQADKAELYIIGSGEEAYTEQIRQYICDHQLNAYIKLLGHISDRDKIYSTFDILINGAIYEGFGRVTIEAMCFGKIPIGLNHSGTAEIIVDKITGRLFQNFEELTEILKEINEDRNKLKALQESLAKNFNPQFTASYYSTAIDKVISNKLNLHF